MKYKYSISFSKWYNKIHTILIFLYNNIQPAASKLTLVSGQDTGGPVHQSSVNDL